MVTALSTTRSEGFNVAVGLSVLAYHLCGVLSAWTSLSRVSLLPDVTLYG